MMASRYAHAKQFKRPPIANCACCAAGGSVGSSATSAVRSPDGPSSRRSSKRRSRALRRSDRNGSASVDGSSFPSTPRGRMHHLRRDADRRAAGGLKSVPGQSRRFSGRPATSGLPRTTDVIRPARLVRLVPKADSSTAANSVLFDHLVSTGQQRSWNFDAKLLRSLEVDE